MQCIAMGCDAARCHTIHTIPYRTVPYRTIPCHAMQCHATPRHAVLSRAFLYVLRYHLAYSSLVCPIVCSGVRIAWCPTLPCSPLGPGSFVILRPPLDLAEVSLMAKCLQSQSSSGLVIANNLQPDIAAMTLLCSYCGQSARMNVSCNAHAFLTAIRSRQVDFDFDVFDFERIMLVNSCVSSTCRSLHVQVIHSGRQAQSQGWTSLLTFTSAQLSRRTQSTTHPPTSKGLGDSAPLVQHHLPIDHSTQDRRPSLQTSLRLGSTLAGGPPSRRRGAGAGTPRTCCSCASGSLARPSVMWGLRPCNHGSTQPHHAPKLPGLAPSLQV